MTDAEQDPTPAIPCSPCRGTGKVISNLGGTASELDCPWCDGTGSLTLEHDAQAHWRTDAEAR